ncbi:SEC-C metal-binding domain-containing protein [Virgibacillus ihumii]|uniref:SEC-C metal-binding domain-containing protein n=1 Tax=Virgibacillus ihumii TaxID=2686091 RepID=UPI001C2D3339|nr:SEC-C metal-binding domain-containing protein [Virgibacillus ihumii]
MRTVNSDAILQGEALSFIEVFGDTQGLAIADNQYSAVKYYVVDMYCMNPGCKCDDVYIQFIKNEERVNYVRADFTVLFSLRTKKYEIKEIAGVAEQEVNDVVMKEVRKDNEMVKLLKQRYKKMKEAGRYVVQGDNNMVDREEDKPNRNVPCICGSGKKYKKCCGA